jgi:hypothetical protein
MFPSDALEEVLVVKTEGMKEKQDQLILACMIVPTGFMTKFQCKQHSRYELDI